MDKLKQILSAIFGVLALGSMGIGGTAFMDVRGFSDFIPDTEQVAPASSILSAASTVAKIAAPQLAPVIDKSRGDTNARQTQKDAGKIRAKAEGPGVAVECIVVEDEEKGFNMGTLLAPLGLLGLL